jgi:repressor of nif and glnA expression
MQDFLFQTTKKVKYKTSFKEGELQQAVVINICTIARQTSRTRSIIFALVAIYFI